MFALEDLIYREMVRLCSKQSSGAASSVLGVGVESGEGLFPMLTQEQFILPRFNFALYNAYVLTKFLRGNKDAHYMGGI